jgi:hypothetical protein
MAGRDPQLEKAIEIALQTAQGEATRRSEAAGLSGKGKTLRGTIGR